MQFSGLHSVYYTVSIIRQKGATLTASCANIFNRISVKHEVDYYSTRLGDENTQNTQK